MASISEEQEQPLYLNIDEELRLRRFDNKYDFALKWYEDVETVRLVDGVMKSYDKEKLTRMYTYLNSHGELYFIEARRGKKFIAIGDVTLYKNNMPIVIGDKDYRKKGIGEKVIRALVKRAKELGLDKLYVEEIYNYNIASRKTFEKVGFKAYKKTEKGAAYVMEL